jgi:hypothetical protein
MRLERSGAALRSVPAGIALQKPPIHEPAAAFEAVCKRHPDVVQSDGQWLLQIRQEERGGALVDSEDRVQKASCVLYALIAAGL